jgi:hypothetical protein
MEYLFSEKLTVVHLVDKLTDVYGTQLFITVFTISRNQALL